MRKIKRRKSRVIKIGGVRIGGDNHIAIQSMAKCPTQDILSVSGQIRGLEKAGCEIVRVAVLNKQDAEAIPKLVSKAKIPIVADIHFNYRLALEAIKGGIHKIRLNPGNIYRKEEVKRVVEAAKKAKIPIRVGVNSGSIRGAKRDAVEAMVKSAVDYIKLLEKMNFYDIVISLKSSSVADTVSAYRMIADICDYPLHLGVTAAGSDSAALIKSSIGIGALLADGIGDTIRVSLTAPAVEEVRAARDILSCLSLRRFGPDVISCPTCGRCRIDVAKVTKDLKYRLARNTRHAIRNTKIAIMGCIVNGPGEARDADLGIAGGSGTGILFRKGRIVKKVKEKDMVREIVRFVNAFEA